jgi:hypothetical protein
MIIPWLKQFWRRKHAIETVGPHTGHHVRSIILCESSEVAEQLMVALVDRNELLKVAEQMLKHLAPETPLSERHAFEYVIDQAKAHHEVI